MASIKEVVRNTTVPHYRVLPLHIMQDGGNIRVDGLTNYCMALHDMYGSAMLRYDKK